MDCHSAKNGPQYLGQLIALFKYILHSNEVQSKHTEFRATCSSYLDLLNVYKKKRFRTWDFNISPNIEIKIDDRKYCGIKGETSIHIGGDIKVEDEILTRQSLVMSIIFTARDEFTDSDLESYACSHIKVNEPEVIRRFHFDIDTKLNNPRNPLSHLQYGGDFSSEHLGRGNVAKYNLFKAVDLPRIPIPPYDIILIFDLIFNQFNTDIQFLKFSHPTKWSNIVKNSELLCFQEYHKEIASHFDDSTKTETVYMHLCDL